jgi:predicted lipid-binding transport protein (Tim44 family)
LRRVQPDFDEGNFVEGAARAYEMILTAFADGDISGVKGFLGTEVAAGFDAAMDQRQAQGQQLITRVLRLDRPVLEDARFENDKVQLDVRFRAELISFTTGLDETVDEAALPAPNTTLDIWTFEGAQGVADPSWALVATQSA